jgi:cytochrome c1
VDFTLTVEDIAKACHEVNRAYCAALNDFSQPPWDEAPDWQKQSGIAGVQHVMDIDADKDKYTCAHDIHDKWMEHKLREGWTYGPVKDPEKKQHPDLLPYDRLPKEQQAKDKLFLAIVRGLYRFVPGYKPLPDYD